MSAPTPGRDCPQKIEEILRNCRTMPNAALYSGKHEADIDRARVRMPLVGVTQLYHESEAQGFSNYPPVTRNDAILTEGKAYVPVGSDNNVHTNELIQLLQATQAAPVANLIPSAGNTAEIEFIYLTASVLAVGRTVVVNLRDGVRDIPIWRSGAGGVASGDAYEIYPVDISTLHTGAAILIGPPVTVHAGTYLNINATGLGAAETIDLSVHWKAKRVAGFE